MSAAFEDIVVNSRIAQIVKAIATVTAAAWRTSRVGRWFNGIGPAFFVTPAVTRLRWFALVVAIAATGHLGLRSIMPVTVVPALPALLFVALAAVSAMIAWSGEAVPCAWRRSRLSRLLASLDRS